MSDVPQSASVASNGHRKPPLARGWPIVGSARALLSDPCAFIVDGYHRYGPAFRVRVPGNEITVLAGPEAVELLAQRGDAIFRTTPLFAKMSGEIGTGHYLAALEGSAHRHLRKALKPGYSREAIAPAAGAMFGTAERIVRSWQVGERLPVLATMQRLVVEQSALAMANADVGAHFGEVATFAKTLVGVGVAFRPKILFYDPRYRSAKRRFVAFLDSVVDGHRSSPPNGGRHPDLVDAALAARDESGCPLSREAVRATAHTPYVNGILYPSRACGFVLYELLRRPAVLQRVADEVDAFFERGDLDLAMLRRLRALRGAVLEGFRLHPIALSLPRWVAEPFEFAGYDVSPGTTVLVGTTVGHFLPRFFPDPYEFDIDRYGPGRNEHLQRHALVPFGVGPHACITAGVVETLIMTSLASVLRHVRLAIDPPGYVLRKVSDPVPGPDPRFTVRVLEHRGAVASERLHPGPEEELGDVLPDLNVEQLAAAARRVERRRYPRGSVVIREGDVADRFFILTSGEVEVVKQREPGEQVIARLGPGSYFGEIGLLQQARRNATVRAADDAVEVLSLDAETFLEIVRENDLTSAEIAREMRRRTTATYLSLALPSLTAEQVGRVSPHFEILRYAPGAEIIRQGQPAERFYIVTRGRVDVVNRHPSGNDVHVARLGPGEFFGEVGLLQRRPRTATVRCAPDAEAEVIALGGAAFLQMVQESKRTATEVALLMCRRLSELG